MRKIFVTGIGTDVGKTVVSSVLTEALEADYWKPVQTGNYYGTDTDQVKKLVSNPKTVFHPEAYSFEPQLSPHAAAHTIGTAIDVDTIQLPNTQNNIIIEGAGGILVPLNNNFFMIDLIKRFDAETILVVQHYLGSINHTLLSIEYLKSKGVKFLGIIFNGSTQKLSEEVIVNYSDVPILGHINKETYINRESIQKYLVEFKNI
ncbi:MAG: dethiobiotin synthase [Bacteroidota bacterium]|jgi:dethiobiotin synthetase